MKKIGIITDIHGNLEMLKRSIETIKIMRIDEIVCLGDVIGYGPNSVECLEYIKENNIKCVAGNHEAYYKAYIEGTLFEKFPYLKHRTKEELDNLYWTNDEIRKTEGMDEFIKSMPESIIVEIGENEKKENVLLTHFPIDFTKDPEALWDYNDNGATCFDKYSGNLIKQKQEEGYKIDKVVFGHVHFKKENEINNGIEYIPLEGTGSGFGLKGLTIPYTILQEDIKGNTRCESLSCRIGEELFELYRKLQDGSYPGVEYTRKFFGNPTKEIIKECVQILENIEKDKIELKAKFEELKEKGNKRGETHKTKDGKLLLKEGTLIHGLQYSEEVLINVSENGNTCSLLRGNGGNETSFKKGVCAFKVQEECSMEEYYNEYNRPLTEEEKATEKEKGMCGRNYYKQEFNFLPKERRESIAIIVQNPELLNEEKLEGRKYDRAVVITAGIPTNFASGILVSKKVENDPEKIKFLKSNFSELYIVNTKGDLIYEPLKEKENQEEDKIQPEMSELFEAILRNKSRKRNIRIK